MTDAGPIRAAAYPDLAPHIDGCWTWGTGRTRIAVTAPGTETVLAELPAAAPADVARAVAAAARGFQQWRKVAPARCAEILCAAASLIRTRGAELSQVMALELGKPVCDGPAEVERAAALFEWHAAEGLRAYGRVVPAAPGLRHSVLRRPAGPVAAFTPWNGPVASPVRKISAALAAGCSVVIKPAKETPASAILILRCLEKSGLPPGVVNMVFGDPAAISDALVAAPEIRLVTFTGSLRAADMIAERVEARVLSINTLGGAAPEIPFGGVKDSGIGREGGAECFDGYLVSKVVTQLA